MTSLLVLSLMESKMLTLILVRIFSTDLVFALFFVTSVEAVSDFADVHIYFNPIQVKRQIKKLNI